MNWHLSNRARVWAALVCALCAVVCAPVAAAVDEAEDAKNRIHFAGRQGALLQQISRDACFVMAGIQPQRYAESALSALRQFDVTLMGLLEGDDNLRINREGSVDLVARLNDIATGWAVFGPASQQIASGDLHSVPMAQALRLGPATFDQSEDVTREMIAHYSAQMADGLATTLWAAHQLAAYALKASNDVCLIVLDIDAPSRLADLRETMGQMDALIVDVANGAPERGVIAPSSRQMTKQLKRVSRAWSDLSVLLDQGIEGAPLKDAEKVTLANLSSQILLEVKTVIDMYLY
ncbi:MAG: hypothetical protein AAF214_08830 [Pseudomonadota bacterium]